MGRGLKWKKQEKLQVQDLQSGGSLFLSFNLEWVAISIKKDKVPDLVAIIPLTRLDHFIHDKFFVEGFKTKFVDKKIREPTASYPIDDKTYGKTIFYQRFISFNIHFYGCVMHRHTTLEEVSIHYLNAPIFFFV